MYFEGRSLQEKKERNPLTIMTFAPPLIPGLLPPLPPLEAPLPPLGAPRPPRLPPLPPRSLKPPYRYQYLPLTTKRV